MVGRAEGQLWKLAMRNTMNSLLASAWISCVVPGLAFSASVDETCALPEPEPAVEVPPASRQEILITSRKLGWVGNQLLQKGRFDEASMNLRDAFNVLVALPDPPPLEVARLANILGFAYTMLESYRDAGPAFELALEYVPEHDDALARQRPPVLLNYVEMLMRTDDWLHARQRLDEVFALYERFGVPEGERAPAYVTRGELALLSGDPAEAAGWLERADAAMAADPEARATHRIAVLTALRESYQLLGLEAQERSVGQRLLTVGGSLRTAEESP